MEATCEVTREGDPLTPEERDFMGFLADLPSEKDWAAIDKIDTLTAMEDLVAVYGQLGVRVAGIVYKVKKELDWAKEARGVLGPAQKAVAQNKELKLELAELKKTCDFQTSQIENLTKSYNDAISQRNTASERGKKAREEVKRLQEELERKRPEEEVLAEFRSSQEYRREVAGAAAAKIRRCWIVAEKCIKTEAEANWSGFINQYMDAEDAVTRGEGEPVPYAPASPPPKTPPPQTTSPQN